MRQQTPSAAVQSDPASADEDCFVEEEDGDDGFKFSGVPIPPRGRPASEDLASRLAILR